MTTSKLPDDYFHSQRAHYELRVPTNLSKDCGLTLFAQDLKQGIEKSPYFKKPTPVEIKWVGERFEGRDLVVFDPELAEGRYSNYMVLEFDSDEGHFYVRDSIRNSLTREAVCNLLEQIANVYPEFPSK